jgi:tetratricopeptide (TPR) repeat protein
MQKLIRELRRREVFRTVGLYVGISWILIEASSVMLPAFDAPEWTLRAVIIIAIIGLPITIVLAWVYDITDKGIEVQADVSDVPVVPFGGRRTDFVVIGVLVMALVISVYMNITGTRTVVEVELEPVSVLIANFDNQTGDPLFDGSLEQALNIGLEGATFVTAYKRTSAESLLETLRPGSSLDEAGARLVSLREGIKLVVSGSVVPDDGGYELTARMVNPEDGVVFAESSASANSKLEVLTAVSLLADDIREELGDDSVHAKDRPLGETFTAASLEAVKNYTEAQSLSSNFKFQESLAFYEAAVADDPNFGRAYSGWALALFNLGKEDEANERWNEALSKMDTMTERERYRTLGLYYVAVTGDFQKGIESYQALVDKFPADNMGYNNLAVAYFMTLDFTNALAAATKGLEIYPTNKLVMSNRALLAMYASDLPHGADYAEELLALDDAMVLAWIPIAMSKLAENDLAGAREAYQNMAKVSRLGDSIATLGLADMLLYSKEYEAAAVLLDSGINKDREANKTAQLATKYIALAEAKRGLGDTAGIREALQEGLAVREGEARLVPAALISLELGDADYASNIADRLVQELQPMTRAYGQVIKGAIATSEGRHADAVDALRVGMDLADLWLLRFYLGRAYFEAGKYVEALDEFQICLQRQGEATALFLDEKPTWRYMAKLQEWLIKAKESMGSVAAVN